jgi:hypothetical protein
MPHEGMRHIAVFLVAALLALACRVEGEWGRCPSPDGTLEAVLAQRPGGPPTGLHHELFIVEAGASPWRLGMVARADGGRIGVDLCRDTLRWSTDGELSVDFQARKTQLLYPTVSAGGQEITVRMVPGSLSHLE